MNTDDNRWPRLLADARAPSRAWPDLDRQPTAQRGGPSGFDPAALAPALSPRRWPDDGEPLLIVHLPAPGAGIEVVRALARRWNMVAWPAHATALQIPDVTALHLHIHHDTVAVELDGRTWAHTTRPPLWQPVEHCTFAVTTQPPHLSRPVQTLFAAAARNHAYLGVLVSVTHH